MLKEPSLPRDRAGRPPRKKARHRRLKRSNHRSDSQKNLKTQGEIKQDLAQTKEEEQILPHVAAVRSTANHGGRSVAMEFFFFFSF
ncbi:hypothetical protein DY000_02035475 [Brassica cretica]|uniref:Uncharacterized protein n=1 Tax=Brassica cretica TaxID=69181 RepID=A0ABQ7DJ07_BRACR|nr:hypothetical protein DY000_02035475 [Brassica cretica]